MPKTSISSGFLADFNRILAGIVLRESLAREAAPSPWVWNLADDGLRCVGAQGAAVASASRSGASWDNANHIAANDPAHVLAVLAAAREELMGAAEQRERHETGRDGERWWCTCIAGQAITGTRCSDAEQADRTIARLLALYGLPAADEPRHS